MFGPIKDNVLCNRSSIIIAAWDYFLYLESRAKLDLPRVIFVEDWSDGINK